MNRLAKTYKHGPNGKFVEDQPIVETWPEAGRGIEAGGAGNLFHGGRFRAARANALQRRHARRQTYPRS